MFPDGDKEWTPGEASNFTDAQKAKTSPLNLIKAGKT
jgi:hypothetical protein